MSLWDELGAPPDAVAYADQLESQYRDFLSQAIDSWVSNARERGSHTPMAIVFKALYEEAQADETGDVMPHIIFMFAAACDRLVRMQLEERHP